jgi:SAM-dependent methyltransferase
MSTFHDLWVYEQQDPMLVLFDHAVKRWGFDLPDNARILELGCRETDWAQRVKKILPDCTIVGIDPIHCPDYGDFSPGANLWVRGDAADINLLAHPETMRGSFDAVVSLGAVEHFGLGYYGDPKGPDKDTQAVINAYEWLKPGGSFYFDVPWTPGQYHETNHYRVYDDQRVEERLRHPKWAPFIWRARGWAPNTQERDAFTDVRPMGEFAPFYFFAQWGVKPL